MKAEASKPKKLSFKPFSEKETEKLLASFPPAVNFITTYRTTQWFNKKDNSVLYGVQMKVNKEWIDVCTDKRALVFDDERIAKGICKSLRGATQREKRMIIKRQKPNSDKNPEECDASKAHSSN